MSVAAPTQLLSGGSSGKVPRVDRVVITHVRVPLVEPFRISSGAVSEKDGIVVALHADGLTGYGESSPMAGSFYSADTPESSWNELCHVVAPAIIGREFECPEDWNRALDALQGGNFTKTGVETAFWDLAGQSRNKPLHEVLGGVRTEVESGLAVGLYDDLTEMVRTVERYLADGYRRVKLKIEPGRDVGVVKAARDAFGDIPLFVDANGAYSIKDVDIFRRLDDSGLMMFEQPFPGASLEELAQLQHQVRTPVCLDESLDSVDQLRRAIALGSFRIANFKIQRVGGFYHALEMYEICRDHGIPAWVGTMPELGIGQAQGAALASLDHFVYPTDVEASDRWFRDDIISPFIQVRNGIIQLPDGPGLGYSIDVGKICKYKVASMSFPE
jgi:O-succinylbenzoate synthase